MVNDSRSGTNVALPKGGLPGYNDNFSHQLPETIAMEVIVSNRFYQIIMMMMMTMIMMMRFMMIDKYDDDQISQ